MNVYDFDKTIYDGDSTIDFYFFCLRHYPWILLKLPYQLLGGLLYKINKINKKKFKEIFFSFLTLLPNIDDTVKYFWNKNEKKICTWYIKQKDAEDIIISASPEFLLYEICKRIHINNLIATKVDAKSGLFLSENCYGSEKRIRIIEIYPDISISNFYSDSYSDLPLARMAAHAYLVKKGSIVPWIVNNENIYDTKLVKENKD